MKLAKMIMGIINEMGRPPTEFDRAFTGYHDDLEKTMFLLAYCTDRQAENHWTKELNGPLRRLYSRNIKGNKARNKNYSEAEIVSKLEFLFSPSDTLLISLKRSYEFDGYLITEEKNLNHSRLQVLFKLFAGKLCNPVLDFITHEEVKQALESTNTNI